MLLSLLPNCGCHITSCLMLLPPCLPAMMDCVPSNCEPQQTLPVVAFAGDFVTAMRKAHVWGWIDGPLVNSAYCSCREPKFSSQHPYGEIQSSVTLATVEFSDLLWLLNATVFTCTPHSLTIKDNKIKPYKKEKQLIKQISK